MTVTGPPGMTYISAMQLQDHVHLLPAHPFPAFRDSLCRIFQTTLLFIAVWEYLNQHTGKSQRILKTLRIHFCKYLQASVGTEPDDVLYFFT